MDISGKARLALLGVTVLASVAATGPALAVQRNAGPQGSGDWRLEYQHDRTRNSKFYDIDGSDTDNLWAIGYQGNVDVDRPLVVRHDGSGWREVPVPASHGLTAVTRVAATTTGAWVLGMGSESRTDSVLLRWTGDGWDRHAVRGETRGGGVDAVADDDVWHATISDSDGALARHWDGRSWTRSALPGDPDSIGGVTARAHDDVWVTGSKGDRLYVAHWSGEAWREATPPPVTAPPTDPDEDREVYFRDFVAVSPQERWALITSSSDDVYQTMS